MVIELPSPPEGIYDDIPSGHWVALSMDEQRVISDAADFDELLAKLHALRETKYVLDRVLPRDAALVL